MLKGKTVILGVTGSIAAYKTAYLASALVKQHAEVHVLMTKNAENFINPITFETLTGNKCISDTFDRNFEFQVGHVSLGKKADLVMIAPASADELSPLRPCSTRFMSAFERSTTCISEPFSDSAACR